VHKKPVKESKKGFNIPPGQLISPDCVTNEERLIIMKTGSSSVADGYGFRYSSKRKTPAARCFLCSFHVSLIAEYWSA